MAVLMPITSPRRFSSGPPELPGLMAASVWMTSSYLASAICIGRPIALMTPTLIVWSKPNGLPMAITQSPGAICDGVAQLGFLERRAWASAVSWMSALSVSWSRPTILAWYTSPSSSPKSATSIFVAPSTTWLFVRM